MDPQFIVTEKHFENIPSSSLVILDDFSFNKTEVKQTKSEFLHVVNYLLRHKNITLCLVIHNLYSSCLLNEILIAPHLFLAYSNLGFYVLKKLQQRLGGSAALTFWQEPVRFNFHFCYINCNRNYIINLVDQLFLGHSATMFANGEKYVIHSENYLCNLPTSSVENIPLQQIERDVKEYLLSVYPKNKNMYLVSTIVLKNNILDQNLFFTNTKNIHFADFCSYINNKFDSPDKTNSMLLKFCKQLQKQQIKFPKVAIKNPIAQKILAI